MSEKDKTLEIKLTEIADYLVAEIIEKIRVKTDSRFFPTNVDAPPTSTVQRTLELMDVNEVAALLKVKKRTIYGWVQTGKIPFQKVGDLIRFDKAKITDWINENRDA